MGMNDMILVSVDNHLCEPPDMPTPWVGNSSTVMLVHIERPETQRGLGRHRFEATGALPTGESDDNRHYLTFLYI